MAGVRRHMPGGRIQPEEAEELDGAKIWHPETSAPTCATAETGEDVLFAGNSGSDHAVWDAAVVPEHSGGVVVASGTPFLVVHTVHAYPYWSFYLQKTYEPVVAVEVPGHIGRPGSPGSPRDVHILRLECNYHCRTIPVSLRRNPGPSACSVDAWLTSRSYCAYWPPVICCIARLHFVCADLASDNPQAPESADPLDLPGGGTNGVVVAGVLVLVPSSFSVLPSFSPSPSAHLPKCCPSRLVVQGVVVS